MISTTIEAVDDELCQFDLVIQSLLDAEPSTTAKGLLTRLEVEWQKNGFGEPWQKYRGALGESILSWVLFVFQDREARTVHGRSELLSELAIAMINHCPELVDVCFTSEPFTGQSPLMQAVANGNEEVTEELLKYTSALSLNVLATGEFMRSKVSCPLKDRFPEEHPGVSVLEVAAIAPLEDACALRLVKRLMDAKAEPGDRLLGTLATSAWHRSGRRSGELVSRGRMEKLVDLVMPVHNAYFHALYKGDTIQVASAQKRRTALQAAAIVGNTTFIIGYLKNKQKVIWQWGHCRQVSLPLQELDREPTDPEADVLELLVLYKHKQTLSLVVFAELVQNKWDRFGLYQVLHELMTMTFIVALVTLACLPKSLGLSMATRPLRLGALVCTSVILAYRLHFFRKAKQSSEFLQKLYSFGTKDRLGIDECGRLRDLWCIALGIAVLTVHELETIIDAKHWSGFRHTTLVVLDALSSIYVFVSWLGLLRYMQYFEQTCVLVSVLPALLKRDMLPWIIIYIGILFSTAVAMRVASWHTYTGDAPGDKLLSSAYQAAWTLEESTHGPDARWRDIVMGQPMMCAAYFLSFLWLVTVIMVNLLISIFSASFEKRRRQASCELRYWRAVEVVYYEKIVDPAVWYSCRLGHQHRESSSGRFGDLAQDLNRRAPDEESPLIENRLAEGGGAPNWFAINEVVGVREWHWTLPED